ncbi:hypothetical protein SAMN04515674_105284 [Pseudarcicella hirudinis]|uniref:Uncharacterized protein n=1 Tax=Pseudarcicella hirudinis TaxID=1079859 RepID=A0A1I5SYU4_9BACT|nr:hypothetical protein [Pseudarcicella hirudinis]SFP75945.1 hypothetical protein SAMN04515674_105284 [Pseudarcicella hirudinis]
MKTSTNSPIEIIDITEYPICYFRFKGQAIKVADIDSALLKSVSDVIGLDRVDIDSTTPSAYKELIIENIEDVIAYSGNHWMELHEDDYNYLEELGVMNFGHEPEKQLLQVA